VKILNTKYYLGSTARGYDLRAYDVSADGTRFLMVKDVVTTDQKSAEPAPQIEVVLNCFEELKAKVPAGK
jgi:hypothetical protein